MLGGLVSGPGGIGSPPPDGEKGDAIGVGLARVENVAVSPSENCPENLETISKFEMPDANGAWESHRLLVAMLVLPILTFVVTYSISLSNGTMEVSDFVVSCRK